MTFQQHNGGQKPHKDNFNIVQENNGQPRIPYQAKRRWNKYIFRIKKNLKEFCHQQIHLTDIIKGISFRQKEKDPR